MRLLSGSFYVILKGAVSIYARKEDDHHTDYHHHHDMGAVRGAQERVAYFGNELGNLKSGKSFGEMVLMSDKKERNATVIADEMTELIVINEELFKRAFYAYNIEWKEKSAFALACPLFASWPTALKALLIENLKMHKIQFGNRVVKQGSPCNAVYFIAKGAAKVLSDPRKCKEQFEAFAPKKRKKKKERNHGEIEEEEGEEGKTELNALEDLVRPLTVIEKRRRRLAYGFTALEDRLRRREIQASFIGPNNIIGDVELVLDIPEYCASVECVEALEVYELDKASFQRLVARRSPETLALLYRVVLTKLRLRVEKFNAIPLFKYLLDRAEAAPNKETSKALRRRSTLLPLIKKPLAKGGRWKTIKATFLLEGQPARQSETILEMRGEVSYKDKEATSR